MVTLSEDWYHNDLPYDPSVIKISRFQMSMQHCSMQARCVQVIRTRDFRSHINIWSSLWYIVQTGWEMETIGLKNITCLQENRSMVLRTHIEATNASWLMSQELCEGPLSTNACHTRIAYPDTKSHYAFGSLVKIRHLRTFMKKLISHKLNQNFRAVCP